jgi:hypothetical protein
MPDSVYFLSRCGLGGDSGAAEEARRFSSHSFTSFKSQTTHRGFSAKRLEGVILSMDIDGF